MITDMRCTICGHLEQDHGCTWDPDECALCGCDTWEPRTIEEIRRAIDAEDYMRGGTDPSNGSG